MIRSASSAGDNPALRGRPGPVRSSQANPSVKVSGSGRIRLKLPPPTPSSVEVLGEGPQAATAVVDLFQRMGVLAK